MRLRAVLGTLATTALMSTSASAEMFWSDFSLSYLNGKDLEFTPTGDMDVFTIEHASGHSWGDTFLFIDRTMPEGGNNSFYGEFSPRLSLGKLSGNELSFGPVKDVLLASTWEMGDGFDNFLYGVGFSLDIPGFSYFDINLYKVSNDTTDDDEQLTLTWAYPFSVGQQDFLIDGFLDWASSSSTNRSEMNFTPQIKWNVGKNFGMKTPLYAGIEYAHWNNKYGSTTDERAVSLLLKWHF